MRNKYDNILSGLIDQNTQLLVSPYIARSNKSQAGTVTFRVYRKSIGFFSDSAVATDFLSPPFILNDTTFGDFAAINEVRINNLLPVEKGTNGNNFSVEFFLQFENDQTLSPGSGYCGCYPGSSTWNWHIFGRPSGNLVFGGSLSSGFCHYDFPSIYQAGNYWVMFTFNNATGEVKNYVNGIEKTLIGITGSLPNLAGLNLTTNTTPLYLSGIGNFATYRNVKTNIGDFRISDKIRTLDEHIIFANKSFVSTINNFQI